MKGYGERYENIKSATQVNVIVNSEYYTIANLNKMFESHIIFRFSSSSNFEEEYSSINTYSDLENVKELKVVYNKEYECYETVAVLNSGELIHVSL